MRRLTWFNMMGNAIADASMPVEVQPVYFTSDQSPEQVAAALQQARVVPGAGKE
jgi:hypothetical protein